MKNNKIIFITLFFLTIICCMLCFGFSSSGSKQGIQYYPDYTVTDQGNITGRSVKNLVDTIGTSKKGTIILTHSSNSDETVYLFETNETIPSNITLEIEPGAYIDGNATLTLNTRPEAGSYKIFGDTLTVVYGDGVNNILPEWRGADPTNTTDSSSAISKTVTDANGRTILFQGQYNVSTLKNYELTSDIVFQGIDDAKLDGKDNSNSSIRIGGNISKINLKSLLFEDFGAGVISVDDPNYIISRFIFENNTITSSNNGVYLRCEVRYANINKNYVYDMASTTGVCNGFWIGWSDFGAANDMYKYIITENHIYNLDSSVNDEEVHGIICFGANAIISENIIEDITNSGNGFGAEGIYVKTKHAEITENILIDAGTEDGFICIKGDNRDGTSTPYGYGVICSGNILYSSSGQYSGIEIWVDDVLVTQNYLEGFGDSAIYVRKWALDNVEVVSNKIIQHRGQYAIFAENMGHRLNISGNFINGLLASQTTPQHTYGIFINPDDPNSDTFILSDVSLNDNKIYATDSNATVSMRGISIYLGDANDRIDRIQINNNKIYLNHDSLTEYGISVSIEANATLNIVQIVANDLSEIPDTSSSDPLYFNFHGSSTITGDIMVQNNLGADETITGATPTLHWYGYSYIDTTSNTIQATLPDAYYSGQIKTIVMTDATSVDPNNPTTVSVTHHVTSDPEVCTFDAVDECWILSWTGTEWVTLYNSCTL